MKKSLLAFCVLAAVSLLQLPVARATTLTFDDVPSEGPNGKATIPSGYGGLTWTNFGTVNSTFYTSALGPSGYANGTVSGKYVAYGYDGMTDIIYSAPVNILRWTTSRSTPR